MSAILYGVVAIMTAELSVRAAEYSHIETALGAIVVGFAMMVTRIFVEVVKKDTEIGVHLSACQGGGHAMDSLLVLLFPDRDRAADRDRGTDHRKLGDPARLGALYRHRDRVFATGRRATSSMAPRGRH